MDKPGTGHNICGEVYEVDDKMLGKLDELEDHPNYYERRLEKVSMMEDKQGGIYFLFISYIDVPLWWKYFSDDLLDLYSKETQRGDAATAHAF